MARNRTAGLTEREAEIMSVIWELGEASVEEIRLRLKNRPAASTVRTLLAIMVERKLIQDDGSVYAKRFRATADQSSVQGSALRRLVDSLFSGSTEEMLMRLVDDGEIDAEQIKALQKRLEAQMDEREK